ncbi:MAG TPA: class I SAM-dependent methyltransferase [candidate division Zixibacteria bacterium]|nr:class I SAM-dependent methyltransferase [candidate division Zixibacteria bacterium]
MTLKDSTKRFSDRVENYIKYRPSYPEKIIQELEKKQIISRDTVIADIGSGTGIFTELLLNTGCQVYAIEPNNEMRVAAEKRLQKNLSFTSVSGTAENTKLTNNSIDLITVAQAFHWFDLEKTRIEFQRILKEKRYIALVWNVRLLRIDFQKEYNELLLHHCPEYISVDYRRISEENIKKFFGSTIDYFSCENLQFFDLDGLIGRVLSSSYSPKEDQDEFQPLLKGLVELFRKYEENGKVKFDYQTEMYYGRLYNER